MATLRIFLANCGRRTPGFPFIVPPLGLLNIAAYARGKTGNLEFRICDQRALNCSESEIVRQAREFGADVVGLSSYTAFVPSAKRVAEGVREALPDAKIVVGGMAVSILGKEILDTIPADMAVDGEGEISFELILQARLSGAGFDTIPGLIWRDSPDHITCNPGQAPIIEDLDSLPFLAYDLLDWPAYWKHPPLTPQPPTRQSFNFTSRGCPYRCTYCHSFFGKKFRFQSAERVVAELAHFADTYGVRESGFLDDCFNFDRERVLRICELMRKRDLKLSMAVGVRTDLLDEEVIDTLADRGFAYPTFPLDSGSQHVQKLINKHLNIDKYLKNVDYATRKGVFAHGCVIAGFPGETQEDVETTIRVTSESALHTCTFLVITPYPSTALYDELSQTQPEKLARVPFLAADYYSSRVQFSEMSDEDFFKLWGTAWREFYLTRGRIARIIRDYPKRSYLPVYGFLTARHAVQTLISPK